MQLGILSDTHGRANATRAAIDALTAAGATSLLHCGDVGEQAVIDQLAGLPTVLIWGNNDWDITSLEAYARSLGIDCRGRFADFELAGRRLAAVHGDDLSHLQSLLASQAYDYVFHGHTHVRRDQMIGRTRVVNPGALFRAREKTVALLDLASDRLRFLTVAC